MESREAYGIYEERGELHQPCVLYKDYSGFWSPVAALYWSTSSRLLVSRHPYSCIEEIISQYCPQCLSRYMDDEVKTSQNRCPVCYQCPRCLGVLCRVTDSAKKTTFSCSRCEWQKVKADLSVSMNIDPTFNLILKTLRDGDISHGHQQHIQKISSSVRWKLADLESSLQSKSIVPERVHKTVSGAEVPNTIVAISDEELTTMAQRLAQPGLQPELLINLEPIRFHLRTKRTIRCRRDVEEGKMSILAQPKMFHLEGDSSQKLQRGKWFVKDSSAVHEVPAIVIIKLPDCQAISHQELAFIHLTITNPKDAPLKVTMSSKSLSSTSHNPSSRPFSCSTRNLVTSRKEDIFFELGAFEDELLRDDDDDVIDDGSINSMKSVASTAVEQSTKGWSCSVIHNVAHLIISIVLASDDVADKDENMGKNVFVLPLTMTTESEDITVKSLTKVSLCYETMIAFPQDLSQ